LLFGMAPPEKWPTNDNLVIGKNPSPRHRDGEIYTDNKRFFLRALRDSVVKSGSSRIAP
jgi:hypothetical protein